MSGQAASMLLGFTAFAYLARVLDPEAYGMVEYAIAVAALAAIIIECGAGNIAVREQRHDMPPLRTITNFQLFLWSHFRTMQSWFDWRHLPNVELLHYAGMKADTPGTIAEIAGCLGLERTAG